MIYFLILFNDAFLVRKKDEIGEACSRHRKIRNAYKIFVGKPEGKRPLGRPRRRWRILKWILRK
jgi:hypothetical protein